MSYMTNMVNKAKFEPKYGRCECGVSLEPVFFIQEEIKENYSPYYQYKTGRARKAIDVLVCPYCLREYCIDDSLDGPWMDKELLIDELTAQEYA